MKKGGGLRTAAFFAYYRRFQRVIIGLNATNVPKTGRFPTISGKKRQITRNLPELGGVTGKFSDRSFSRPCKALITEVVQEDINWLSTVVNWSQQ